MSEYVKRRVCELEPKFKKGGRVYELRHNLAEFVSHTSIEARISDWVFTLHLGGVYLEKPRLDTKLDVIDHHVRNK